MPFHRYRPVEERVALPLVDRTWPQQRLTAAPLWVPVDLRDGNQALAEPMGPDRKRKMLELLLAMGYKEIEVGYPSASQADFDFVRMLAEGDILPDDVTIVVFTAARRELIERTFASIVGLTNVVIHMYTATAPIWRDLVLHQDRDDLLELILAGGEDILRCADDRPGLRFQFSPEVFNQTEPDYVLEVCNRMTALWDASPDRPVIHNLPATVEIATPNIYADQIEYMHRHLDRRESVILSIHPHNDRGTGVACAELAMLTGAERVEGCLFGNGERTGNVDLVTLALNLHAQGVDPMIDFSDIDMIRKTVEYTNRLPVHERHPYAGDLVYTAFSGTHQDAIKKGFAHHNEMAALHGVAPSDAPWAIPYLAIDPADVGRDYEAVIRVNSQSGKGGIAYLLLTEHGLDLPRQLQIAFARVVQETTDATGQEITASQLWELFKLTYMDVEGPVTLNDWSLTQIGPSEDQLTASLDVNGVLTHHTKTASGPVSAMATLLEEAGFEIDVLNLVQQAIERGRDSQAVTYLEAQIDDRVMWGVGADSSVLMASFKAMIAAVNRSASGKKTTVLRGEEKGSGIAGKE